MILVKLGRGFAKTGFGKVVLLALTELTIPSLVPTIKRNFWVYVDERLPSDSTGTYITVDYFNGRVILTTIHRK